VAYGTANDPELAYKLSYIYGKAMVAVGVHVTFEPYANEIGAQYGENPEHIAAIVSQEVKGMEDAGFASCVKHWIGRGGDSNFGNARSIAQNFDNWMVGWTAALSGGNEWVMTNCGGTGITNTTDVKWDKVTMSYLRDTLGFNGVVVTDWWALGMGGKVSGVTNEGLELSEQSFEWLYADAIVNGTDMFGAGSLNHGLEVTNTMGNWPDVLINAVETGVMDLDALHESTARILRFKFVKGTFENPYRVAEEALAVVASPEYQAEQWPILTNEDLRAARTAEEVELAEQLQAKSAVLMKNEGGILPLAEGAKVYIESSAAATLDHYKQYIAEKGEVVDEMEDADVCIGYFSSINDAAELFIEDAQDEGKPIILTMNTSGNSVPNEFALTNADAVLYLPFSQQPDHGSGEAGFIYGTEPWVYADLLFGVREPEGIIQKEQARSAVIDALQWKDLAGDQGASPYVRLLVQAIMEDDPNHASPNNYGDPLVVYNYSMRYGQAGEFAYSCLILPQVVEAEETENSWGSKTTVTVVNNKAKAGEPFSVYALLRNNGGDDLTTVQLLANGEVIAEKLYTVCGGSWRIVEIQGVLEAGEYTIELGGMSQTLTVE
jgi:beta-glucosidase-like glycosyl hydrolase